MNRLNKRQAKSVLKSQWKKWVKDNKKFLDKIKKVELEKSIAKEIDAMVSLSDYTPTMVLKVFYPLFEMLGLKSDKKAFLREVYSYILEKSFPDAVEIPYHESNISYYKLYLEFLNMVCEVEKRIESDSFISKYPMDLLTPEEERDLIHKNEYLKFKKAFIGKNIYELMKINKDITGFNSIDHICGVYYIAMNMARKLKKAGIPIDLGVICGASACHDVGKFGCVGDDAFRVPYLHYYYTDIWFQDIDAPFIGNIAVNHSTWDLELENLSIESLVLIYSDFRVKNKSFGSKKKMHIFGLDESFRVILNMLDNVDEKKENRYKYVYNKLKDFESFMESRGVSSDIYTDEVSEPAKKPRKLMYGTEIIDNIKNKAVYYNIRIIQKLSGIESYNTDLEIAANKDDWRDLRGYLTIYEGYSSYFTLDQKLSLLAFLYDMLSHKEEDIQKNSAELMGRIISSVYDTYRKELPERITMIEPEITSKTLLSRYGREILFPDSRMIDNHRFWIRSNFSNFIRSLSTYSSTQHNLEYIPILKGIYNEVDINDRDSCVYALEALKVLPFREVEGYDISFILSFIRKCLETEVKDVRIEALNVLRNIFDGLDPDCDALLDIMGRIKDPSFHSDEVSILYFCEDLNRRHCQAKGIGICADLRRPMELTDEEVNEMFLFDLKAATSWIEKYANISILKQRAIKNADTRTYETVMHFCNLLKVSETENVRNKAGQSIVDTFPVMKMRQRNEVCVELVRALDIQEYQFSKFIPPYLGQLLLFLDLDELKESLNRMSLRAKTGTSQTTFLVMGTVGIALEHIVEYRERFNISTEEYDDLVHSLLGILLSGLYNYNDHIKHEAFRIIGKNVFGSSILPLDQKIEIFNYIGKKINNSLIDNEGSQYTFFNDAASLNHIYRFISEYEFFCKGTDKYCKDRNNRNIAFFPGTFDPFSLGHKEIAKKIRDLGFDVYLAVDEFSWSKRTQPNSLRRKIIDMSIADEFDIYTFPEEIQVNLTNDDNLKQLKRIFEDNTLYMVVGSDVVMNASCYKSMSGNKEINTMNHLVFKRMLTQAEQHQRDLLYDTLNIIKGDVRVLTLEPKYEEISSTQIRNYVDENKDISNIIDPLVQKFIYEYGIYRREPQYKDVTNTNTISLKIDDYPSEELLNELCFKFFEDDSTKSERLFALSKENKLKIAYIRHIESDEIMAFSIFFRLQSYSFFKIFEDELVNRYVRNNSIGNIILIGGIYTDRNADYDNLEQIILTETLAQCLKKDYTYAIYKNMLDSSEVDSRVEKSLFNQGFLRIDGQSKSKHIYAVNMAYPIILNFDLERVIKEPFKSNKRIKALINRSRGKLQKALTQLYPGELVLSFYINILNEKLVERICRINKVKGIESKPRRLGKNMCVPFGSALEKTVVPNTVTKFLHTEKVFDSELTSFEIEAFPHYLSLENQVKMIKAFDRPVILTDDLLHKGYRIKAIDRIFKEVNVPVLMLVFGVMSGRGKELMDMHKRDVDSVYFIPNLRNWFNERSLYPYIGGDSIRTDEKMSANILDSINFILPYASPGFIRGADTKAIYDLSSVCIENAIEIHQAIEIEYRNVYERNFTLRDMGDVFSEPRTASFRGDLGEALDSKPSEVLLKDLESLKRLRNIIYR